MPNFTVVTLKMCGLTDPKIGNFLYKFVQKGVYPLSNFFIQFGLVEGVPCPHLHAKFYHSGIKNVGLRPQKSQKKCNFWYKFSSQGKSSGSIEKLEYRCTTTNLPLSNDTIIVLIISSAVAERPCVSLNVSLSHSRSFEMAFLRKA